MIDVETACSELVSPFLKDEHILKMECAESAGTGKPFAAACIPRDYVGGGIVKRKLAWKRRMQSLLNRIHLVDKWLILFLAILLMQSAYHLFTAQASNTETSNIDAVLRTSMASIFGNLLSANFSSLTGKEKKNGNAVRMPAFQADDDVRAAENKVEIRYSAGPASPLVLPEISGHQKAAQEKPSCSRMQVIIAGCVGLMCIVALIIWRNFFAAVDANITATIAQFRDLISGCVGFLIGCPSTKHKSCS